eukprot:753455-Hanusia_phi.AAC.1
MSVYSIVSAAETAGHISFPTKMVGCSSSTQCAATDVLLSLRLEVCTGSRPTRLSQPFHSIRSSSAAGTPVTCEGPERGRGTSRAWQEMWRPESGEGEEGEKREGGRDKEEEREREGEEDSQVGRVRERGGGRVCERWEGWKEEDEAETEREPRALTDSEGGRGDERRREGSSWT